LTMTMLGRTIAVAFALVGCQREAVPPAISASLPPAPQPSTALPPRCEGVALRVDDVAVRCWPSECPAVVPVRIENCGDRPARVVALLMDGTSFEFPEPRVVAPRETKDFEYPPVDDERWRAKLGAHEMEVRVRVEGQAHVLHQKFSVIDAVKEQAMDDCAKTHADWGWHGGLLTCEPFMPDAGKKCSDESECQGACVLEESIQVSPHELRLDGRCSKFRVEFGCHLLVGKTNKGRIPMRPLASVCRY
jgi:hypothetical protein